MTLPGGNAIPTTLLALVLLLTGGGAVRAVEDGSVHLTTPEGGQVHVSVELAETPAARARGLMVRESLPAGHGMWFDFGRSGRVMMWMKNTQIPLDMLFIRDDCTVVHVVEDAVPESLEMLGPNAPVRWVLEVNAGFVAATGAGVGSCARLGSAMGLERHQSVGKTLE